MILALVDGQVRKAEPGVRDALCPTCGEAVVAKTGELVRWHFAHKAAATCDPWAEGETDWHLDWKSEAPVEQIERIMGPHRADAVAADGTVVEFQHSAISAPEIRDRERFYRRMMWVFDASEAFEAGRLATNGNGLLNARGQVGVDWTWRNPRRSLRECRRRVLLDLGSSLLELGEIKALPIDPGALPIVTWAGAGWAWSRSEFVRHLWPPRRTLREGWPVEVIWCECGRGSMSDSATCWFCGREYEVAG